MGIHRHFGWEVALDYVKPLDKKVELQFQNFGRQVRKDFQSREDLIIFLLEFMPIQKFVFIT